MMKKGDIWIATVIYIAIGVVTLTLIMSTGIPLINDMRDRNTFVQSKEVMHFIDEAVSEVISEGPGSRRVLNPVVIKKGELTIKDDEQKIFWQMETKAKVQEISPGKPSTSGALVIKEKNLEIVEYDHDVLVDYYIVRITLNYKEMGGFDLITEGDTGKLSGRFGLVVSNEGFEASGGKGDKQLVIKIRAV